MKLAKQEKARFFSHLDMGRALERSLRRAAIPVALSQGFSPHPLISFVGALPTGTSSEGEFVDIELAEAMDSDEFVRRVNAHTPPGLAVREVRPAPEGGRSVWSMINMAEYRLTLVVQPETAGLFGEAVASFLGRIEVAVTKEGKRGPNLVNIRPQVHALWLEGAGPNATGDETLVQLRVVMEFGPEGNLKPDDFLKGFQSVAVETEQARLALAHRIAIYRLNLETGMLEEPWSF